MRFARRALDKLYKRRDRYEIPEWQRQDVWSADKKRLLIDTILRGWRLPKFYFQKTNEEPDEFDVVDGQQRLTAIWEFMDGELKLTKEQAAEFGGDDYESLLEALADAFDDYEIEYDEITEAGEEELKEFFQRLQKGLPLTSSEKLNSIHSKLRDYCARTARHQFFSKTIAVRDKRYARFDIVSKVATIEIEGIDARLRFDDIRKVFQANSKFSPQSAAAKRINRALKFLHANFPENCSLFRNRTIVQSVITLVCHLQQAGLKNAQEPVLKKFIESFLTELRKQVELGQKATNLDYLEFQRTVTANLKSGGRTRQTIMLRHLFRGHPDFWSNLGRSADIAAGLEMDRKSLAEDIRDAVRSINDRYAGVHGGDLFKATNKTAAALGALGKPIKSLDDYKNFIDNTYFVFRESLGQRLAGKMPKSFKDVNDLRTMVQHDVDHGKPREVAKKRKGLAGTFRSYSGAGSPDAVDPADFTLVQVNILGALLGDLNALEKSTL